MLNAGLAGCQSRAFVLDQQRKTAIRRFERDSYIERLKAHAAMLDRVGQEFVEDERERHSHIVWQVCMVRLAKNFHRWWKGLSGSLANGRE